jgi:hypothetical protein
MAQELPDLPILGKWEIALRLARQPLALEETGFHFGGFAGAFRFARYPFEASPDDGRHPAPLLLIERFQESARSEIAGDTGNELGLLGRARNLAPASPGCDFMLSFAMFHEGSPWLSGCGPGLEYSSSW